MALRGSGSHLIVRAQLISSLDSPERGFHETMNLYAAARYRPPMPRTALLSPSSNHPL